MREILAHFYLVGDHNPNPQVKILSESCLRDQIHGWGFLRAFNPKSDRKSTYRVDVTLTLFSGGGRLVVGIIYLITIYFLMCCSLQTNVNLSL